MRHKLVKVVCCLSVIMLLVIGLSTNWLYTITTSSTVPSAKEVILLVLIHSSAKPEGRARRDIIRRTWVSSDVLSSIKSDLSVKQKVVYKFVLGGKNITKETMDLLEPEVEENGDMILLPQVTDEHATLTQRTLDGFVYIIHEKVHFSYVLKCDDDTFVDLQAIMSHLQTQGWKQLLYWGQFVGGFPILSEGIYAEHKWFICDRYFPYAFGGGYVLSRDLIELIVQNSPYLRHYVNEDVSLASWLAPYNLIRIHDQGFDTGSESRGCFKPFMVAHKVPAEKMPKYYRSLRREGRMCGRRTRTRRRWIRHLYNWNTLPTQCCD